MEMRPEEESKSLVAKVATPLVVALATASAMEPVRALLLRVRVRGKVPVAEVRRYW